MDYESFKRDAGYKRRSIKDLARFIATRTDNNPNYSLLFGAGCSISSGVKSATQLSEQWRQELYASCADKEFDESATPEIQRAYLKAHESSWYYPDREYSSLFEKRYDLQRQRRMFVENEVAGKIPSIGYAYLTSLIGKNYFNTIFTTNFDDILNEAFYSYSVQRPIVCAHDSSINSITVTSKRPKIIKIHGDYLFDDLKSTIRETENLEQNIKAKFTEFAKDFGLIVVGYSGCDRSVMDVLASLLRNEEYLKHGIYWCLRPGSEVSEELRKLIWRDRVYFVEIDGFDELFAELFHIFTDGQILPDNTKPTIYRSSDTTAKLLGSSSAFPTSSPILKLAREKLERQSKRTNLVNLIVRPNSDDSKRQFSNVDFDDDELAILAEIQNFALDGAHDQAIEMGQNYLRQSLSKKLRVRILNQVAIGHRALNQKNDAIRVADELISIEPRKASHHLLKASFQAKKEDQLKCIENAIKTNEFAVDAHLEKARYYVSEFSLQFGEEKSISAKTAHACFDMGIQINPNWKNSCWIEKFNLFNAQQKKESNKFELIELIEKLTKQNPYSACVLDMRRLMLDDDINSDKYTDLTKDIKESRERNSPDLDSVFDCMLLKLAAKRNDAAELRLFCNSAVASEESVKDGDYAVEVARIFREKLAEDSQAIEFLNRSISHEFDVDVLFSLISSLTDMNRLEEANKIFEKWTSKLLPKTLSKLKIIIFEMDNKFGEALIELRHSKAIASIDYQQNESYLLLRKGDFIEAEILLYRRLESINFSLDAGVDIVNYEFSRKKLGKKINLNRLASLSSFYASDSRILTAVYAVLGKKKEMYDEIKKVLKSDKTFRFEVSRWPVFDEYRTDPEFGNIRGQGMTTCQNEKTNP